MTYEERNQIYQSEQFAAQCRMALCDWVDYWAVNGTASIEDEDLRRMTDDFLRMSLSNPESYVGKIMMLVIAEPNIIAAAEITDEEIRAAVTHIMSAALSYIL